MLVRAAVPLFTALMPSALPMAAHAQSDPAPHIDATADVPCTMHGARETRCPAAAMRGAEQIAIEVRWPGGRVRTLLFDAKGKFVTAATAQADGSATYRITSHRSGDWTTIIVGPETYRVPDAFILGD